MFSHVSAHLINWQSLYLKYRELKRNQASSKSDHKNVTIYVQIILQNPEFWNEYSLLKETTTHRLSSQPLKPNQIQKQMKQGKNIDNNAQDVGQE